MIRKSFLMTLKPGTFIEYQKRHNPIWPELQKVLKDYGVHNYSIFLDRSSNRRLFGYVEIESEELWRRIATTDVCRRWWTYMKDLMLTNDDDSPVTTDLSEVFHID
jgi:L-rhamnose mutarotase